MKQTMTDEQAQIHNAIEKIRQGIGFANTEYDTWSLEQFLQVVIDIHWKQVQQRDIATRALTAVLGTGGNAQWMAIAHTIHTALNKIKELER